MESKRLSWVAGLEGGFLSPLWFLVLLCCSHQYSAHKNYILGAFALRRIVMRLARTRREVGSPSIQALGFGKARVEAKFTNFSCRGRGGAVEQIQLVQTFAHVRHVQAGLLGIQQHQCSPLMSPLHQCLLRLVPFPQVLVVELLHRE